MSLARRQYNARHKGGSQPIVVDSVPIDSSCDWDLEAIQIALYQAEQIEEWDREAARQLRAQAQAARTKLDGSASAEPLDLIRLYARVIYHYKGGITDADLARIDYRRFFGYVRELDLILQEEAEAAKGSTGKQSNPMEAQAALNSLPRATEYEGEVIKLI